MSKFVYPITNFGSGELSENLYGRIDVREYTSGLSYTKNALINPQGGVYKRIGSKGRGIANNLANAKDINILEFTLEDGTSVILEILESSVGSFTMRLLDYDLNEINLTYEYFPPFSFNIQEWNGVSIGTKIYITNYSGTVPPWIIDVSDISNAIVKAFPTNYFKAVPFLDANTDQSKEMRILNANDLSTNIIEANFNAFEANHLGAQIMVGGLSKMTQTINADGDTDTFNKLSEMSFLITNVISATQVEAAPYWSYENGSVLGNYSGYPIVCASTTNWFSEWRFGAWSFVEGFPRLFSAFEGRLIACGTKNSKDRIFASKMNDPFVFQDNRFQTPERQTMSFFNITRTNSGSLTEGPEGNVVTFDWNWDVYNGDTVATDPYQFAIASKDSAPITWLESSRFGVVGTYNKQHFLDGDGSVVSQTNVNIRPFATKSSAPLLAVAVDNTVFYTDSTKTRMYMYLYNESNGSYISKEVTLLYGKFSSDNQIKVMRFSREFSSLMCITTQGDLIALTYSQESKTLGFSSFFKSTNTTKILDYVSVNTPEFADRGIAAIKMPNGSIQYHSFDDAVVFGLVDPVWQNDEYLEKFNYLDKFYSIFELYSDTVVGLNRFDIGAEIKIYATDGTDTTEYIITTDGSDTYQLPQSYKSVAIGEPYEFEIATMPIEAGQSAQTAQLGLKRVDKGLVRTADCSFVKVSTDGYNYEKVAVDGNKAILNVTGSPEYDHRVFVLHDEAGPCMINNMTLRGVSNDG